MPGDADSDNNVPGPPPPPTATSADPFASPVAADAVWAQLSANAKHATTITCEFCRQDIRVTDSACPGCARPLTDQDRAQLQVKLEGGDHLAHARGREMRNGSRWIGLLAILFAISAPITYISAQNQADDALTALAGIEDSETLEPIDGRTLTAGELRAEVEAEPWVVLGAGLLLAAMMGGLWLWGRRSPLPAIACAIALFIVVQVVGAISDPSSIMSGIIIKVLALVALGKGLSSALAARAAMMKRPAA